MSIKVGDRLPSVTLTTMTDKGPKPLTTTELCEGKKVVLFAVPGHHSRRKYRLTR